MIIMKSEVGKRESLSKLQIVVYLGSLICKKKFFKIFIKRGAIKVKKLFALFLSLITVLAACGNKSEETDEGKKTAGEKVKIEYWHVNAETQGGKTVKKLIEDFNKQSDTVEVVEKFNPDMYKGLMQNMQSEIAGGKSPDVVQIGWSFKNYFVDNFEYVDPQTIIDENFEDDKTFLKDKFDTNILELAQDKDGKQIGVPYSISSPVLYINKDLLKKAGVNPEGPKTWEEVEEFSKKVKDKTKKYGLYIQEPADNWAQQALLESNGSNIIKDGKAAFADESGVKAYQMYQDMVVKDKTALHTAWDQGVQSFIDGNVAMLFTTIAQRTNVESNAKFDATAIQMPSWEGKERKIPAGGAMLAITSKDKEKQKASWEFMKYLYSIEGMSEWTKGTGYVPPRNDVAEDPKGLKKFLDENEMMKPAIEQMDSVVPWASFPGQKGLDAEQKLLDMRDKILGGNVDVKETMTSTQEEINKLLK